MEENTINLSKEDVVKACKNIMDKATSIQSLPTNLRQSNDFIKAMVFPELLRDSKLNCSPTINLQPLSQDIVQRASKRKLKGNYKYYQI